MIFVLESAESGISVVLDSGAGNNIGSEKFVVERGDGRRAILIGALSQIRRDILGQRQTRAARSR